MGTYTASITLCFDYLTPITARDEKEAARQEMDVCGYLLQMARAGLRLPPLAKCMWGSAFHHPEDAHFAPPFVSTNYDGANFFHNGCPFAFTGLDFGYEIQFQASTRTDAKLIREGHALEILINVADQLNCLHAFCHSQRIGSAYRFPQEFLSEPKATLPYERKEQVTF